MTNTNGNIELLLDRVQEGDLVKILDKEKALELNPRENITTAFWKKFSNKIVTITAIIEDFLICSDGTHSFQVFACDVETVFSGIKYQAIRGGY